MDCSFSKNDYFLSSVSFFFSANFDPDMNKYANMFTLLAYRNILQNILLDTWPINIGSLLKNIFRCGIKIKGLNYWFKKEKLNRQSAVLLYFLDKTCLKFLSINWTYRKLDHEPNTHAMHLSKKNFIVKAQYCSTSLMSPAYNFYRLIEHINISKTGPWA